MVTYNTVPAYVSLYEGRKFLVEFSEIMGMMATQNFGNHSSPDVETCGLSCDDCYCYDVLDIY